MVTLLLGLSTDLPKPSLKPSYSSPVMCYVLLSSLKLLLCMSRPHSKRIYLNKYAFINPSSFPQYLDASSWTQLTCKRLYSRFKVCITGSRFMVKKTRRMKHHHLSPANVCPSLFLTQCFRCSLKHSRKPQKGTQSDI